MRFDAATPTVRAIAIAIVALLAAITLAPLARAWWREGARAARFRARVRHAAAGELRAEAILRRFGYDVRARQAIGAWRVHVDGAPRRIELRADYVVTRGRRSYVAEVKTGRAATRIESAATRRQMLEYRFAFDVDGVLLVDADAETVSHVEFPTDGAAAAPGVGALATLLAIVFALGALAGGAAFAWLAAR